MREKERKGALERVSEVFDIPGGALSGLPKLEFTGNRRLHIEGHKGVLEYDSGMIAVNAGPLRLRISGGGLEIVSMSAEELLIAGNIEKFEFER